MTTTPDNHYHLYVTPIGYICECGDVVKLPFRTRDGSPADAGSIKYQAILHKTHYHEFLQNPVTKLPRDTVTIHYFQEEK